MLDSIVSADCRTTASILLTRSCGEFKPTQAPPCPITPYSHPRPYPYAHYTSTHATLTSISASHTW
ncbi:hypothetical protein CONLIGDRAFT_633654 [Coniochaeta ligniaria NRRL 30616]|uniref:Uncharacterized protein n=1 Tax=Coniochaeta ligniaria NRRL 30616 TaxID=1408157 RepID=A0A1J7IHU8_9PEZI|nr:hypothetical protein CONLIGDRAFT_633654 [Coniochaeta ligniaria NRRL 30616]